MILQGDLEGTLGVVSRLAFRRASFKLSSSLSKLQNKMNVINQSLHSVNKHFRKLISTSDSKHIIKEITKKE